MKQIEIFQMLGEKTRLRALALMQNNGELCVCELVAALDLSQPKISRHLAALRDVGLLTSRRDAQWVFYTLSTTLPDWQQQTLNAALTSIKFEPVVQQDAARLTAMENRPQRCTAATGEGKSIFSR
ncbi:MAG: metalloregulator ArsR/SmtB family transcription factor, partial [Planctomycetota bacterium]